MQWHAMSNFMPLVDRFGKPVLFGSFLMSVCGHERLLTGLLSEQLDEALFFRTLTFLYTASRERCCQFP